MKRIIFILAVFVSFNLFAQDVSPDFSLENLEGDMVSLYEVLEEKEIVIIDFWATWCVPCVKALPYLNDIYNEYPDQVEVFAITVDDQFSISKVKPRVKTAGWDFSVLYDTDSEVKDLFGIEEIPVTIMVGKDKKIFYRHSGFKEGDQAHYKEEVVKILGSKGPIEEIETDEEEDSDNSEEGGE